VVFFEQRIRRTKLALLARPPAIQVTDQSFVAFDASLLGRQLIDLISVGPPFRDRQ